MRGLIRTRQQLRQWVSSLTYSAGESMIAAQPRTAIFSPMSSAFTSRNEITAMLRAWSDGKQHASDELISAVYDQLRRQARRQLRRERRDHTLDTAALINEAYIKLDGQRAVKFQDRGHFFALAAELMRRILVDHARAKHRQKRGGHDEAIELEEAMGAARLASPPLNVDLIALDDALNRLALLDEQQVRVVELRYFAGLGLEETADALDISVATVKREWAASKAWLRHELTRGPDE
jgi:RNA polymerase sigma-70 factor (ECF subfamily)